MKIVRKLAVMVCFMSLAHLVKGQMYHGKKLEPDSATYQNIYVKKLHSDSLSSSFAIWVKQGVKAHKHEHHTEVVTVIEGKGEMSLGQKKMDIKAGDVIVIPMGTVHSVVTTSRKPLLVVSVQSPQFKGKDRIWVKEEEE